MIRRSLRTAVRCSRVVSRNYGAIALRVQIPRQESQSSSSVLTPVFLSLGLSLALCNHEAKADTKNVFSNFVADVVEEVSPAVVNIRCKVRGPLGLQAVGAGSGFIINSDGYIVTNAHVVEHSVDGKITVCMKNGSKKAGIVHSIDSISDIALVKLEERVQNLPVIALGSSGKTRAGEFVVAIGSPSNLSDTVSFGIVSTVSRSATELGLTNNRSSYIQTDAAINRGNSGGPLVNMNGEVIGVCNMTLSGTEGVSFAIPIDTARQVIDQLMRQRRVVRPYMGFRMANMTRARPSGGHGNREMFELLNVSDTFVQIQDVSPGSPADRAGLRKGDIIEEVDGKPVTKTADVFAALSMDVGQTLVMRMSREGLLGASEVTARLTTAPDPKK